MPDGSHGIEAVHGQWFVSLLVLFLALSALLLPRSRPAIFPSVVLAGLFWMFFTSLAFMALLGIRANRYMVDFQAPLMLALVLCAATARRMLPAGPRRHAWLAGAGLLGIAACAANVFAAIQQFDKFANTRPVTFAALARLGALPSAWGSRFGGDPPGTVRFHVTFPPSTSGITIEPILTAGTYGYNVCLYVRQHPDNRVEFLLGQAGAGGAVSLPVPVVPGRIYELGVELGAFYPPALHPMFDPLTPDRVQWLKTRERVTLDGATVLEAAHAQPDAPPGSLVLGRNDVSLSNNATSFRGRVFDLTKIAGPLPSSAATETGGWRWKFTLPPGRTGVAQPLLETGAPRAASLLTLVPLADDRVRFIFDTWGYGAQVSPAILCATTSEHVLEVYLGPVVAAAERPAEWTQSERDFAESREKIRVWLDGRLVWSAFVQGPVATLRSGRYGANTLGFSGSILAFEGGLSGGALNGAELRSFLERNRDSRADGLWRLDCQLAPGLPPGKSLPLLATGKPGAGNLLYLQVLADQQVRLGFDQWGAGNAFSAPLPWPPNASRTLEIFVGPAAGATAEDSVRVWIDGRLAWSFPVHNPPSTFGPTSVGTNSQGFSTATGVFAGRLEPQPLDALEHREFPSRNLDGPPPVAPAGLWRLLVAAGAPQPGNQPLLAFGRTGTGNLVYLAPQADGTLCLGLDEWGLGGGISAPFTLDPNTEHEVEIFAGPASAAQAWPAEWAIDPADLDRNRSILRIWIDGRPIWSTAARNAAVTYAEAGVGTNLQGFSTAARMFGGRVTATPYTTAGQRDFLQRNLARPTSPSPSSRP